MTHQDECPAINDLTALLIEDGPVAMASALANGDLWKGQFFAPCVDMGQYPAPDLDGLARKYGVGLFTLGFMQSSPSGKLA